MNNTYIPAPPRFRIASRFGALRDTSVIPDPFGTSAKFTVRRANSNAHKVWQRAANDTDPIAMIASEQLLLGSAGIVLTEREQKAVDDVRAKQDATARLLLPIVDRLTTATAESNLSRDAARSMFKSGKLKASDILMRGLDSQLDEATFLLCGWEDMPGAEEGSIVEFSSDAAAELLTNDTPVAGAGFDDLIMAREEWTVLRERTVRIAEDRPVDAPQSVLPVVQEDGSFKYSWREIIPKLTIGLCYQLHIITMANNLEIFRSQVLEAAAKNSPPSSGSTSSSGDATREKED